LELKSDPPAEAVASAIAGRYNTGMTKYAVIALQGHQYKVAEGEEILVDRLNAKKPEAEVLLVVDEKKVHVGKPTVKAAKVSLKIVSAEVKGEKLYVRKYKAKSRYRKKTGFRPKYTKLLVQKITL
jgi:large subunit ribosomal protein L21